MGYLALTTSIDTRMLAHLVTVSRGLLCPVLPLSVEELMRLYPDAKVVITVRDPDKWWKSMEPVVNKRTSGSSLGSSH